MVIHRETLEERVIRSRDDNDLVNSLIKEFKPFIASVAQKRVGRYLEYGVDDELSVGLLAFREAIRSFKEGRARFLSFARMVISMRLIDYYRKLDNNFEVLGDEENQDLWDRQSVEVYQLENDEEDLKAEVIRYSDLLSRWGIDMVELARVSPRNGELRKTYQEIARKIAGHQALLNSFMETKRIPIKELQKDFPIHRKKLERGRIYIIAMILAITSGFSYMDIGRGGE